MNIPLQAAQAITEAMNARAFAQDARRRWHSEGALFPRCVSIGSAEISELEPQYVAAALDAIEEEAEVALAKVGVALLRKGGAA